MENPKEQAVPTRITFDVVFGAPPTVDFDPLQIIEEHLRANFEVNNHDDVYVHSVEMVDWEVK